jgi:hypothetical protein
MISHLFSVLLPTSNVSLFFIITHIQVLPIFLLIRVAFFSRILAEHCVESQPKAVWLTKGVGLKTHYTEWKFTYSRLEIQASYLEKYFFLDIVDFNRSLI